MALFAVAAAVLAPMAAAMPQLPATVPTVVSTFCNDNLDYQTNAAGVVQPNAFNYSLCASPPPHPHPHTPQTLHAHPPETASGYPPPRDRRTNPAAPLARTLQLACEARRSHAAPRAKRNAGARRLLPGMDVAGSNSRLDCHANEPCPGGADLLYSVFTDGTMYSVTASGCTSKPCTVCGPPGGMPFSFIVIDNDSRATASLVGTATIDGEPCPAARARARRPREERA